MCMQILLRVCVLNITLPEGEPELNYRETRPDKWKTLSGQQCTPILHFDVHNGYILQKVSWLHSSHGL